MVTIQLLGPLEEGNHELLVRSLAVSGDRAAALHQVAVCEDLMRRELGIEASASLRDAASVRVGSPSVPPLGGRAAALSQLDAGRAAIVAGAVDAGLQCLRRAVAESEGCGDPALRARALAALGGSLVHAVRGRDEEGAVVLHAAVAAATAAFAHLDESVGRARSCDDHRQQAFSLSLLARAHLLRGERSQAAGALTRCLELVHEQRWIAFQPWPQALRAELDLYAGDVDGAADHLHQAWTLACQLDDPCWEGMAARGLGLLHARRGDGPGASRWLGEATARCNRVPDRYQWIRAHVLDTTISAALDRDDADLARPLVTTLSTLAARCEMRELVVRAHLHRGRLGDPTAYPAARLLATGIDNPALAALVSAS